MIWYLTRWSRHFCIYSFKELPKKYFLHFFFFAHVKLQISETYEYKISWFQCEKERECMDKVKKHCWQTTTIWNTIREQCLHKKVFFFFLQIHCWVLYREFLCCLNKNKIIAWQAKSAVVNHIYNIEYESDDFDIKGIPYIIMFGISVQKLKSSYKIAWSLCYTLV